MSENKEIESEIGKLPIDAEAICPTEKMLERIKEDNWPPIVKVDEETSFQLTEMDVSWTLCTVLGMKWADAQAVPEGDERVFLYAKSLMVAEGMAQAAKEAEEVRQQTQEAMRKDIDSSIDSALANNPGSTVTDLPPELPEFAKFNL